MSSIALANMSCMFYVFLVCVKCNILICFGVMYLDMISYKFGR